MIPSYLFPQRDEKDKNCNYHLRNIQAIFFPSTKREEGIADSKSPSV
jgi:hypothetical protein